MGRVGLSIPTWLSVTAIVACGDDENGDEQADTASADDGSSGPSDDGSTGPSDDGSSGASTAPSESSGEASGDTGSTSIADGSTGETGSTAADSGSSTDTGELPDCMAIGTQVDCEMEPACIWHLDFGPGCVVNCELIEDQATCDPLNECAWYDGMCEFEFLK